FDHGDVPPELRALAEDGADRLHVLRALARGHEAVDANFAARGHEDAGQHLDRGAFPGAVRTDVADHFAALDGEADAIDRGNGAVVAHEKILDRAPDSLAALKAAEMLRQVVNVDQRFRGHERGILPSATRPSRAEEFESSSILTCLGAKLPTRCSRYAAWPRRTNSSTRATISPMRTGR